MALAATKVKAALERASELQQQLLEEQAKQLNAMSNVVDAVVDRGIRSYRQVVTQTIGKSGPVLSEQTLIKQIQETVTDDDRSKNDQKRSKNVVVARLAEEPHCYSHPC